MEKIKKILKSIFRLSAINLGVLVTIVFCFLARDYYLYRVSGQSSIEPLQHFLQQLHLKSIDYRMLFRGDRRGSQDIAILTIDQEAIDRLGRWPWSRNIIAQTIDELMTYDARLVAFDIIFSEHDENETLKSLKRLQAQTYKDPKVYEKIEQEIQRANTDNSLSEVIEKHADKLVMGSFYDTPSYRMGGANESCANLIYSNQTIYPFITGQDLAIATTDLPEVVVPSEILDFLQIQLSQIALQIKTNEQNLTSKQIERRILDAQLAFCARWLHKTEDRSLGMLKDFLAAWIPSQPDYQHLSVEDFLDFLRYSFPSSHIVKGEFLNTNLPEYNEKTKYFGYFNAYQDKDGPIRRSNLIAKYGDSYLSSIALKTYMVLNNRAMIFTQKSDPVRSYMKGVKELQPLDLESGDLLEAIPVDMDGTLRINYAGPQKMFPHLSVGELFNNKDTAVIQMRNAGREERYTVKKADWIKDKIFVFGATATGIYDLRVTPFEENFPGVETHANVIDNLVRKDFLKDLPNEVEYMFYILLLLGLLLTFAISYFGAIYSALFTTALLSLILFVDYQIFFSDGIVVNIVLPLSFAGFLYLGMTIFKYFTEERTKRDLKGTFQKYVSPAIVEEVLKDAKNIELGGKKIRMSVLFSDVRGFTTISEKLDPRALSDFLNSYLTPMTDLVFKNKGTLDKYMGDAVMAFFGAPIQYDDHAKMACKCALDMMDKLDELKKEYRAQGLPEIDIGIGINTGEMSVGNMGSETVRSYTVMGDAVNLGSRLEGINKEYGTNIIISQYTYEDVKTAFVTREVDRVRVKGKLEPVKIYELVGINGRFKDEKKLEVVEIFKGAYGLYCEAKFEDALKGFEKALRILPDDGPSQLFRGRCLSFMEEAPPRDWDGVYVMNSK